MTDERTPPEKLTSLAYHQGLRIGAEKVQEKLEIALGALADIAFSGDMTLEGVRAKAKRIYESLREPE